MVVDRSFPKFSFSLESLNFDHRQETLSVVSLEVTGSLFSFLRKRLPKTQIWITLVFLPVILSSKNSIPGKSSSISSQLKQSQEDFSSRWPSYFSNQQSASCVLLTESYEMLRYTQELRCHKISSFCMTSLRTSVRATSNFPHESVTVANTMTTSALWPQWLDSC